MKRIAFIIALVGCAALSFAQQSADDWFWGKPIASVQWEGIKHVDKRELDATVRPYIGKTFTDEVWSDLQARVYELDWFDSIEPAAYPADKDKTQVLIKFVVVEKPAVEAVKVSGNSGLRTNEILDAVQVKSGDLYNASKVKLDELAIRRLYQEKGYPDALVSSSIQSNPSGVAVTFSVVEGGQVSIKELRFTGNAAFSAKTLKAQLGLKEASLFQSGAFQEAKLEEDKAKLVSYYKSKGYIDAAVLDVTRSVSKDAKSGKNWLTLTFAVKEGKVWNYGGMSFEGNKIFGTDKLAALCTQKAGSVVNYSKVSQDKQRVDDLYYENGYIFNQLDLEEKRDDEKATVSYVVHIVERDRAHIESIAFKGNTKTKEYVLARELPLEVGDIFSKAKVVEGLRNLYNLQYFSSIEPEMHQGSADNLMDLVVSVEEQSTADVQFGVTLSGLGSSSTANTFPLSGVVKWNEKNFRGMGQTVGVELTASPTDQVLSLSFLDSWLFGKRISGGIDLSFEHETLTTPQDIEGPTFSDGVPDPYTSLAEYESAGSTSSVTITMPYEYWDLTLSLSTGYSTRSPFGLGNMGVGLGFSSSLNNIMYDEAMYRPASSDIRSVANQWLWTNKVTARAYLNGLDLWYNPTKGYYASERLTWAGFIPSLEAQSYVRSDTRLDLYHTLFSIPISEDLKFKWVLGGHSALSAIMPHPGDSTAKVLYKDDLRIDGTFVGRGWSSLYSSIDDGRTLWDNWLELRMPILEQYFWLDGFIDADALYTESGLLQINSSSVSVDSSKTSLFQLGWDNMVMSTGFGIRFTIPQFPFRFYFAKRFSFDGSSLNWTPDGADGLDFVISISQSLN